MRLLELEEAILAWISERQPALAPRLTGVDVAKRHHTGVGLYTYFSHDDDLEWDRPPVDGPIIASSQLPHGAGSLLWLSQGRPNCLEIYAFGSEFPEDLDEFQLSGSGAGI